MREFLYQRLPDGVPQSVVDALLDTHGDVGEQAAMFAEANSAVPDATKFWPYLLDGKWYIGPGKLIGEQDNLTPEQQTQLSRYQNFGISQEAGYMLAIEQAQQAKRDTDKVIKSNRLRAIPQDVRDALMEATVLEGPGILDGGIVNSLRLRDYDGVAELLSYTDSVEDDLLERITSSGNAPGTEDLVTEVMRNTAINETGRADFSNMGQIAREANGTKSYGILGLNSGDNTSGTSFVAMFGEQLGLTAPIGSTEFDAQWAAATETRLPELLEAHEQYVETDLIGPAQDVLRRSGLNKFGNDSGVLNTVADAIVQYGPGIVNDHLREVAETGNAKDVNGFYDEYESVTLRKLPTNFRTHLSKFPEQLNGLENRARNRVAQGRALSNSPGNLPAPRRRAIAARNQAVQNPSRAPSTPPAPSLGVNTDTPEQIAKTESSGVATAAGNAVRGAGEAVDSFAARAGDTVGRVTDRFGERLGLVGRDLGLLGNTIVDGVGNFIDGGLRQAGQVRDDIAAVGELAADTVEPVINDFERARRQDPSFDIRPDVPEPAPQANPNAFDPAATQALIDRFAQYTQNAASDRQLIGLEPTPPPLPVDRPLPRPDPIGPPGPDELDARDIFLRDGRQFNIDPAIEAVRERQRASADRDVLLNLLGLSDSLTRDGQAQAQRSGAALDSINANASAGGATNADIRAAAPTNVGGLTAKNVGQALNSVDRQSVINDPNNNALLNNKARSEVMSQVNATRAQLGLPIIDEVFTLPVDVQADGLFNAAYEGQIARDQALSQLKLKEDNLQAALRANASRASTGVLLSAQDDIAAQREEIARRQREGIVSYASDPFNLNIPTGR